VFRGMQCDICISKKGVKSNKFFWRHLIRMSRGSKGLRTPDILNAINGSSQLRHKSWLEFSESSELSAMWVVSLFTAAYPNFTPRLTGDLGGGISQDICIP